MVGGMKKMTRAENDLEELALLLGAALVEKGVVCKPSSDSTKGTTTKIAYGPLPTESVDKGIYFNDLTTGIDTILPSSECIEQGYSFYDKEGYPAYSIVIQVAPQEGNKTAYYVGFKENVDGTFRFGVVAVGSSLTYATVTNIAGPHTPHYTTDSAYREAAGTDNNEVRRRTKEGLRELARAKEEGNGLTNVLPAIVDHVVEMSKLYT